MSTIPSEQLDNERSGANDALSPEAAARRTRIAQVVGVTSLFLIGGYLLVGVIRNAAPPPKAEKKPEPVRSMVAYVEPVISPKAVASPQPQGPVIATVGRPTELPKDDMLEAARRAPLTAFNSGFKNSTMQSTPNAPTANAGAPFVVDGDPKDSAFAKRFQATAFDVARAGHIGDRRFIVAQGTSIPCVLETAMQSDQPGFVSCVISRDVLSDNGRVVLMEKGTHVVGEYRGGMSQGQSRLHVMWSRAKTPEGVVVTLASAATDALGRAGVGGTIDNHWWERFGSAVAAVDRLGRIVRRFIGAESQGRCRSQRHQPSRHAGRRHRGRAEQPNQADAAQEPRRDGLDLRRARSRLLVGLPPRGHS